MNTIRFWLIELDTIATVNVKSDVEVLVLYVPKAQNLLVQVGGSTLYTFQYTCMHGNKRMTCSYARRSRDCTAASSTPNLRPPLHAACMPERDIVRCIVD